MQKYEHRQLPQRFHKHYTINQATGCWEWHGSTTHDGYAEFRHQGATRRAHRLAYTEWRGPIPDGYVLDHLCRVRHCVNPDHLEAVTCAENLRRGHAARRRLAGAAAIALGIALGFGAGSLASGITSAAHGAALPASPTWTQATAIVGPSATRRLYQIARCEQPGPSRSWGKYGPRRSWGVRFEHPGPTYVGGFGLFASTARAAAQALGYPMPPKATPAQQLLQAKYVADRWGYSAWGCA